MIDSNRFAQYELEVEADEVEEDSDDAYRYAVFQKKAHCVEHPGMRFHFSWHVELTAEAFRRK